MQVSFNTHNQYRPNLKALDIPKITKSLHDADQFARLIDDGKVLTPAESNELKTAIAKAIADGKKAVALRLQEILESISPK